MAVSAGAVTVSEKQLHALAADGLVVVKLPSTVYSSYGQEEIGDVIKKDIALAPDNGHVHAQIFRDIRQKLHWLVVESFLSRYIRADEKQAARRVEQLLDSAVFIGEDGHNEPFDAEPCRDAEDTILVGFVNLSAQKQRVYYVPGSHNDSVAERAAADDDGDDGESDDGTTTMSRKIWDRIGRRWWCRLGTWS